MACRLQYVDSYGTTGDNGGHVLLVAGRVVVIAYGVLIVSLPGPEPEGQMEVPNQEG